MKQSVTSLAGFFILLLYLMPSSLAQAQTFTKVDGPYAAPSNISFGVSWGDYNNDGYPDLYVSNTPNVSELDDRKNELYLNNGDGTFSRVLSGAVTSDQKVTQSSLFMDVDNDGLLDIYANNNVLATAPQENDYYKNNGDGTFSKSDSPHLTSDRTGTFATAFSDYDKDGDLDFFVGDILSTQNYFYRNDLNDQFVSLTEVPFLSIGLPMRHANWVDYDNDGDDDLYIQNFNNLGNSNRLYRNLLNETGTASFEADSTNELVTTIEIDGAQGANWIDYDNDGDLDAFVTTFFLGSSDHLFANDGKGNFSRAPINILNLDAWSTQGSCWGDYDNDGNLDLFVTTNQGINTARNLFYLGDGQGDLIKVNEGTLVEESTYSSGCAHADYDNDGDLDLFVTNGAQGVPGTAFLTVLAANDLFRNDSGNQNNWINVSLRGTESNTFGVGAKVYAHVTINGEERQLMRWVNGGSTGDRSQNDLRLHFGLGDAAVVDQLTIEWPSGLVESYESLVANQFFIATEGENLAVFNVANEDETELPDQMVLDQNYPNPFNPSTTIRYHVAQPGEVTLTVFDLLGREVATLAQGFKRTGSYEVTFSGTDLPSGLYVYQLRTEHTTWSRTMVLQK